MTAITVDHSVELFTELRARVERDGYPVAYAWLLEQDTVIVALALTLLANDR